VVQSIYKNGSAKRTAFGIAAVEEYDGITTILESISDVSSDIDAIERLVEVCNNLQLDPIHLQDVVSDFLATV
jgi:hypothetical protein